MDKPEPVLTSEDLAELRRKLSSMSITGLQDFYRAAHFRCGMKDGKMPAPRDIQQLVQAGSSYGNAKALGLKLSKPVRCYLHLGDFMVLQIDWPKRRDPILPERKKKYEEVIKAALKDNPADFYVTVTDDTNFEVEVTVHFFRLGQYYGPVRISVKETVQELQKKVAFLPR